MSADAEALELLPTADGSLTLRRADGVTYHSTGGAVGESAHVFIAASGLEGRLAAGPVAVLEVGYGTGLNFLLIAVRAHALGATLAYTAYEPSPPPEAQRRAVLSAVAAPPELVELALAGAGQWGGISVAVHALPWPQPVAPGSADVVVYDAFGPGAAPELWVAEALRPALEALRPGGCLVTFSVTGAVRRLARDWGYRAERLPGYPPKRKMLRIIRAE